MGTMGIEPGVRATGVALVERGRWRASDTLTGRTGCAADWPRCATTARMIGAGVLIAALEWEPERIAIAAREDRPGLRPAHRWRHTTAAVSQAIYDALCAAGLGELITWQSSHEVLRFDEGLGALAYLLEQGRAGIDAPGPLPELEAAAICHACHAEELAHAPMAGLAGAAL